MKILLDIDGVVADFVGHLCNTLSTYGLHYAPAAFTDWDIAETLSKTAFEHFKFAINSKYWCEAMPGYELHDGFLSILCHDHQVVALTAATESSEYWFNERLRWNKSRGIKKTIFCPSTEKADHCGDVLIEDNLLTATQWAAKWVAPSDIFGSRKALLINRPWNRGPTPFGVYRVSSYNEALELINS